jgi:hypothetical protein
MGMIVRPFDWRDIPALQRYRQSSVFLDSALLFTRGPLSVPGALLSYLAPSMGIFTGAVDGNGEGEQPMVEHPMTGQPIIGQPIIGQFIHPLGSPFAHLTFLAPDTALETTAVSALLDYLVTLSGERGALRLLADVDECSVAFETLRRNNFAIYTRQHVWQLVSPLLNKAQPKTWRTAHSRDALAIRSLYNNLVPGLVQQVEPFVAQRPQGVVYYKKDELLAYVELKYGHRGIWAQPFVHPNAENIAAFFVDLLQKVPNRRSRPVYICVRSYQSWLESAIEELGAEAGPRQAVMVKHMAIQQKVTHSVALPALEGGQAEISAPLAHLESK